MIPDLLSYSMEYKKGSQFRDDLQPKNKIKSITLYKKISQRILIIQEEQELCHCRKSVFPYTTLKEENLMGPCM